MADHVHLVAEAAGHKGQAELSVKNHLRTGPVFSGPHKTPFECRTEQSGLGAPLDADCSVATRTDWFYLTADGARKALLDPLGARPADVTTTTTIDGKTVPFIVRVEATTWNLTSDLEGQGWSLLRGLLAAPLCDDLASLYGQDAGFRGRVVMARHSFGQAEYRYFSYPLPSLVERLRTALYSRLVPVANEWHERMGMAARFPAQHAEFIARCAASGQSRPTPLLLQ